LRLALWVNRRLAVGAARNQEAARKDALGRAVLAIRESVTFNGAKAESLRKYIEDGNIPFEVPLEVSRWEAVRDEFVRTAHDAELQGRVAYFFDQVERAARMADRHFEFAVGMSAATTHAQEVAKALRGQLLQDLPTICRRGRNPPTVVQRNEISPQRAVSLGLS
jgi:hypothetical protein